MRVLQRKIGTFGVGMHSYCVVCWHVACVKLSLPFNDESSCVSAMATLITHMSHVGSARKFLPRS